MQGYLGILLSSFALQAKRFQGQSAHVDLRARGKPALKQAPKHTCVDLLAPPTASVGQPGAPAQTWASEEGADWSGTCIPTAGAAGPPPSMFCLVLNGSLYLFLWQWGPAFSSIQMLWERIAWSRVSESGWDHRYGGAG